MDWSWGDGALVSGPAEAILLGINRRDMSAELAGDGVAKLPSSRPELAFSASLSRPR